MSNGFIQVLLLFIHMVLLYNIEWQAWMATDHGMLIDLQCKH
jgi:hypothetical protein